MLNQKYNIPKKIDVKQIQKIKTIVDLLKIPENAIACHLNWGTFTLRDVVTKSGGASPFGDDTVKYRGSSNDAALNAAVLRFKADPQASVCPCSLWS